VHPRPNLLSLFGLKRSCLPSRSIRVDQIRPRNLPFHLFNPPGPKGTC